jgi:hypothetical protein
VLRNEQASELKKAAYAQYKRYRLTGEWISKAREVWDAMVATDKK